MPGFRLFGCLQFAIGNLQSEIFRGVLAQLVERLNGIEEVTGSNPVGSMLPREISRQAESTRW